MKMKYTMPKRIVSFLLMLSLLVGALPMLTTPAQAIYHPDNAAAATAEQLASTEDTFVSTDGGGMLRIIDGTLWVWGRNTSYGLGLANYNDAPTTASTTVPNPVKHDFAFGGEKLVKVVSSFSSGVTVLTENGNLYSWGSIFNQWCFSQKAGTSADGGRTPVQWDLSRIPEGRTIVDMKSSSLAVCVKDDQGDWYFTGESGTNFRIMGSYNADEIMTLKPIPETFIDKLQKTYNPETGAVEDAAERVGGVNRRTIMDVFPSYGGHSCFFLTTNRNSEIKLFAVSRNHYYRQCFIGDTDTQGQGVDESLPLPIDISKVDDNEEMLKAAPDFTTINTNGIISTLIDASGSVWLVGSNQGGNRTVLSDGVRAVVPAGTNVAIPTKVYDATMNGSKCVKTYISTSVVVFLTEDNSIYAIGKNANQFITTMQESTEMIFDYTQVFSNLSKQQTITGIYPTDLGVMVVSKSGEQFWSGDNSGGTAGNGTTDSPEPGQIEQSVPTTIPPIEPVTENKIIFEIEDSDGCTYRTTGDVDNRSKPLVQKYDKDGNPDGAPSNNVSLKAGKTFKLNVYFRDFGKLTSWVVPIRFDKSRVKVVNGAGQEYPDAETTPGSIGPSVGINKCFTTQQWSQGVLIGEGGTSGTYPKICNGDSWVSVAGYTLDKTAVIEGEVKMFSIDFTVVNHATTSEQLFDFATSDNVKTNDSGLGYDKGGRADRSYGPYWKVTMEDDASQAHFDFNYNSRTLSPFATMVVVNLKNMSLIMERSDGVEVDTEDSTTVGSGSTAMTVTGAYAINKKNTTEVYKISVSTNDGANDASYPQADWTVELLYPNNGVTTQADYFTVVEQRETYLRVKLPDNFSQVDDGIIRVTAKSKRYSDKTAQAEIVIKGYDAPKKIAIDQKASLTDETKIYDTINPTALDATFTVSYPGELDGFANLAVTWKLLDKNGNELDTTNMRNAASVRNITQPVGNWNSAGTGFTPASAQIAPAHTTFGEDYLILHVESLYDPAVYDEVKIKVHLKATELEFRQTLIRMPTDSTKDLNTLLSIGPDGDYYDVDLEWSYVPYDDDKNYIIFNGTGVISSGSDATPAGVPDAVETVTVTDRISGESDTIEIIVISLNSPIKPDDVTVHNLLGEDSDYITVNGLQEGDYITFYQEYLTPEDQTDKIRSFGPLTAAQAATGSFNFPVRNFLKGEGGEIGMQLKRKANASDDNPTEYDRVPVGYDCEPSKVYGYIKLAGKETGAALTEGIQIQLSGLSSPDVVTTDRNGYFEFTTYIIPGNYTMTIYKDNYLKRVIKADTASGYQGLVIPTGAEEFAISTEDDPIVLYPGDLNADGAINATDVNQYVRSWVGRSNSAVANFEKFNFYDGTPGIIDLDDLDLLIRRNGWVRENYPKWITPATS